jgi:hypothetical protein
MPMRDIRTEMRDRGLGPFGVNDVPPPDLSVRALNALWDGILPDDQQEKLDDANDRAEETKDRADDLEKENEELKTLLRQTQGFLQEIPAAESLLDEIDRTV